MLRLPPVRLRRLPLVVLVIAGLLLPSTGRALPSPAPLPAATPAANPPVFGVEGAATKAEEKEHYNRAVLGVYHGIRRALEAFASSSKGSVTHEAVLHAAFLDASSRAFYFMSGALKLPPAVRGPRTRRWCERLHGTTVTTNGSIAIDLAFTDVDRDERGETAGIHFELTITCIPARVVDNAISIAMQVSTLGTFVFLKGGLVPFLEAFDANLVARAVSNTLSDLVFFVGLDVGSEAFNLATGGSDPAVKAERQARLTRLFRGGLTPGAIFRYVGEIVLQLAQCHLNRFAGAAIGAVVAATIWPAGGAAVAGLISLIAVPIVGALTVSAVSVDIPLWYRIHRLMHLYRRLPESGAADEGLLASIRWVEERLLRGVDDGIRQENYAYFDKLVGKLQNLSAGDRALFQGLVRQIQDKLQFATLANGNWNASRKYYQMLGKLRGAPSTAPAAAGPGAASPAP